MKGPKVLRSPFACCSSQARSFYRRDRCRWVKRYQWEPGLNFQETPMDVSWRSLWHCLLCKSRSPFCLIICWTEYARQFIQVSSSNVTYATHGELRSKLLLHTYLLECINQRAFSVNLSILDRPFGVTGDWIERS